MPLPIVFRRGNPAQIASYSFSDVATGLGYMKFFAGRSLSSNVLSNVQYSSGVADPSTAHEQNYTHVSSLNNTTFSKQIDLDFDALLSQTRRIKGFGVVSASLACTATGGGTGACYALARVRKWDGSTETEIAASVSGVQLTSAMTPSNARTSLDVNIPETLIKKGEYLRLTIEVWAKHSSGGAAYTDIYLAHDPAGNTTGTAAWDDVGGSTPSDLSFLCPVRIDL